MENETNSWDTPIGLVTDFARRMSSFRERIARIEQQLSLAPDGPKKAEGMKKLRFLKEKINPRMERMVLFASKRGGLDKSRIAARFEIDLAEVGSILRSEGIFQ
jgi:hypothetical protein